jgi:hypothetical protein
VTSRWTKLPHFHFETLLFSRYRGRPISAHTNTVLPVPSIFASIFFSGTKYLIYSSSLRKSLTEEETVPYGITIIIYYVGNELSLATVSRVVSLKREKFLLRISCTSNLIHYHPTWSLTRRLIVLADRGTFWNFASSSLTRNDFHHRYRAAFLNLFTLEEPLK